MASMEHESITEVWGLCPGGFTADPLIRWTEGEVFDTQSRAKFSLFVGISNKFSKWYSRTMVSFPTDTLDCNKSIDPQSLIDRRLLLHQK